jgi:hypothetical protein
MRAGVMVWFAGLILTLLVACAGGGPPAGSGGAVLPDTTKALDEVSLASLSRVTSTGSYTFDGTSPVLESLEVGDVFVVGVSDLTPQGALRQVEAIDPQGEGYVVATGPASLQDAFASLQLSVETVLTPSGPAVQQGGLTFPLDLSVTDAGGRIDLRGSLSLAPSLDLSLDLDIAAFELKELSLDFGASETFLATLTGQGSLDFDEGATIGVIPFAPIVLTLPTPAGPLPVVLTPQVVIEAGLQGSIRGGFEASVTQQAEFGAGLRYRNGTFEGVSDSGSTFDFDEPLYDAAVGLRVQAGPRLEVLLYGAVGPFAAADAYLELSAAAEGPPPCVRGVVNAGLTASAGVDLLADYETTLFNQAFPLTEFDSCNTGPGAPRPTVTWARSFGRSGSPGERAGAVLEASDGTFLVVGASDLFGPTTGANASLWAMRLDALGTIVWQRAYGGPAAGFARAVQEVPGGFVIASARSVMKIDTGGNPQWVRSYEGNGLIEIASLAAHDDGSLVAAGRYGNVAQGWAMRLDPEGRVLWSRRFGGDGFSRVRVTSDGGHILVGGNAGNAGNVELVKLAADGSVGWRSALDNRYDPSGGEIQNTTLIDSIDWGMDVVERSDGGYIVVGESYGGFPIPEPNQPGFFAPWIAEVGPDGQFAEDDDGNALGSTLYRAPADANYGNAYALLLRPNGNVVVVGRRADQAGDLFATEDILILQGGAISVLGGQGNDTLYAGVLGRGGGMPVALTQDGGVVLAATSSTFAGQEQVWVVKMGRTANINFGYLANLAGVSITNDHARSLQLTATVTEAPIAVTTVTAEVEVTGVESLPQAP